MKKWLALVLTAISFIFLPKAFTFALPVCPDTAAPEYRPTTPPPQGEEIADIQKTLRNLGLFQGEETGRYDNLTAEAVKKFQLHTGLKPTGIFDRRTREMLCRFVETNAFANSAAGEKKWAPRGKVSIVVDIDRHILTVYDDGRPFMTYPVAVGKEETPSPVGEWKIIEKTYEPGGPFGSRWMGLNCPWAPYGIHGTDQPWSIGRNASRGCIRMYNDDVAELFEWVPIGTPVKITGNPLSPYYEERRRLSYGSCGSDVVLIQQKLKEKGYYRGKCDGYFLEETASALKKFQKDHGFQPTGIVDADIYAALGL